MWLFYCVLIVRIHSLLGSPGEDLTQTEFNEPDCSSITDIPNSDSVYFLIEQLNSHLDLTEKIPDDYAKQVSLLILNVC